jgi:hypothetical protein
MLLKGIVAQDFLTSFFMCLLCMGPRFFSLNGFRLHFLFPKLFELFHKSVGYSEDLKNV